MALIETIPVKEDYRRKIAQQLMREGMSSEPVLHWAQGLGRLGQAALGGYQMYQADQKDNADLNESAQTALMLLQGGGAAPSTPAAAPAGPSAAPAGYGNAISSIESGGKYDALGPVTKSGDRAYGKYQVMGANIPQWSKEYLGQEMTPQAFVASPEAQDKVFQGKFGSYAQKYGPEGAAKAWFAGEKGMNNPNAKDQLGTTVSSYGQRFMKALGGEQPYDVAGPATAAPQGAPQVAQPQRPPVNPLVIQLLQGTPNQKKAGIALANQLAAQQFKPLEKTEAVKNYEYGKQDPNFAKLQEKPPEHGDIGIDPNTGLPIKGWIDPRARSTTPFQPPAVSAQPSTIPPVPAGVDPKVWREAQSKRVTEEAMPASGDAASKLRNEVQGLPSYKNIAQAAPVYKSMLEAAGRDTRAADVNMIYGMAKIMDPGSVVRESEMTVAQAIATLPQQLQATVQSQLQSSGRLTPEVREAIMQEAHSRIGSYQSMFDQDISMYRGIAQRGRMNEADVLPSFGPYEQYKRATKGGNKTKSGVSWSVEP
jgi:hypothetical protein